MFLLARKIMLGVENLHEEFLFPAEFTTMNHYFSLELWLRLLKTEMGVSHTELPFN